MPNVNIVDGRLPRTEPKEVGISPDAILTLIKGAKEQNLELHSLMVLRHGKVAAEGWWAPYQPTYRHLLWSVSKSFTSTAIGFAISEGLLTIQDKVLSFFPEYAPADPSPNLEAMTLWHLITMTTGQDADDIYAMAATGEPWEKCFLARPVPNPPGSKFFYNSTATYMLSSILQKKTGQDLMEYLKPRLFDPLEITEATWQKNPQGVTAGGWGLSLATESIAKFGQLYLQRGVWNGEQLLPKGWVEEATAKQVENGTEPDSDWDQGYGYQFWRSRFGAYRGDGMYGQFCVVDEAREAVVAITANSDVLQPILNLVWPLLASYDSQTTSNQEELESTLTTLEIKGPEGQINQEKSAKYTSKEGPLELDFKDDSLEVKWPIDDQPFHIGKGHWIEGAYKGERVAAWGAWTEPNVFETRVQSLEQALHATIRFQFEGQNLTVERTARTLNETLFVGQIA